MHIQCVIFNIRLSYQKSKIQLIAIKKYLFYFICILYSAVIQFEVEVGFQNMNLKFIINIDYRYKTKKRQTPLPHQRVLSHHLIITLLNNKTNF